MKLICKICGREFKNYKGLGCHIITHNLPSKEYYNKYLKKENEGLCLECGKKTNFKNINKGYHICCSYKCKNESNEIKEKSKQTMIEKYGVENPFQNEEIKEKKKETCLKNYGVENPFQNEEIKEKIKQTNLKNYGCKYPLQNEKVEDKRKQTYLKKYGVENPFQNEEIKGKSKQTCLKNHGVEHSMQSEEVREKSKQINMEKYGCEYPSQNEEIKEKIKQTNLKKYGHESPFQNEEIKEKIKQTNLKRYGVEHHALTEERKSKMKNGQAAHMNSLVKNISKPQVELFEMIKEIHSDAKLNYQILNYSVDIVIPSKNIAIEYDGSYWHKNKEDYDKKRQQEIEILGWRFIRYMDYVPSTEELINDINNIYLKEGINE